MLCDDGVLEDFLLGRSFLALLGDGGLVLFLLEFAAHFGGILVS